MIKLKQHETQQSSHWSNYWRGGQLTSLPQDFKENYSGEIQKQWFEYFDKLVNNSTVLDMCAGNCAIALLAASYASENDKTFNITAVDAARIVKKNIVSKYPDQQDNLSQINIISPYKVEDINLAPQQFDLITSQYGIEYCDWDTVAQKIHKLLKVGGHFAMISHTSSSQIMSYMNDEKNDYYFLYEIGLFKSLLKYSNNKFSYRKLFINLIAINDQIRQNFTDKPSELLRSMLELLNNILAMGKKLLNTKKTELRQLCLQHNHALARLHDLFNVTQRINDNPNWYEVFIKQGLTLVEHKPIMQHTHAHSGNLYYFRK